MHTADLVETMLKEFGPLMSGEELRRALGYRTWAAFARAVRMGTIGIPVFEIPNRRGRFALTIDVAKWLIALRGEIFTPMPSQSETDRQGEKYELSTTPK